MEKKNQSEKILRALSILAWISFCDQCIKYIVHLWLLQFHENEATKTRLTRANTMQ